MGHLMVMFGVNFEHVRGLDSTTSGPQDFFDFLAFSVFLIASDTHGHDFPNPL
jgi:hypothetical protein